MPRLTKQQLDAVRYVSMDDFIYRINQIENIDDKVEFATRYLLTYGLNGDPDVSFYEALYTARAKIADASYDLKEEFNEDEEINEYVHLGDRPHVVNPYATENEYDMHSRTFMAYPFQYLKAHAMKLAQDIEDQNILEAPEVTEMKEHYLQVAEELSNRDEPEKFDEFEKNRQSLDINIRMREKYNGKRGLNRAISATKSNFITKLFDSNQYKAFKQAEKNFHDPNHEDYGDTEDLETAAATYLMHKLPNWNPNNGFPTEEMVNTLSGKSKARVTYAINLVKSLHEYRNKEHNLNQLTYHNRNKEFEIEDAFVPEKKPIDVEQSEFQDELDNIINENVKVLTKEDLNQSDDNSIEEDEIESVNNSQESL